MKGLEISELGTRMQESPFANGSRLLSVSIRLGLPPALGILTVLVLTRLVSVASASVAAAPPAPGDLDATFGTTGVVTTPIGPGDDLAYDVAVQEDGKIVAAGYAHSGSDNDFVVVRYQGRHSVYLPLILRNS